MSYGVGLGRLGKYARVGTLSAGLLGLEACNSMQEPPKNALILNVNYDCACEKFGGDFWDMIRQISCSEGQPCDERSGDLGDRVELFQRYNPHLKNPIGYHGRFRIPDINGDGKFLPQLMDCGYIENQRNQPDSIPGNSVVRKTNPRTGK
jgi:hypothetical protein